MNYEEKPYSKAFIDFAKDKPEVLCISADLTGSCEIDKFRDQYPDRFFSMGMAEQNMISVCGGLALEGFKPFIHTFAVFLYRRAIDQIICSIAYSNRNVRLMGFLPGLTTPGGITHQAIEDIAVFRSIPNMTVLETGDATEVETVLETADSINGPVYVRVLRGNVIRLFNTPFKFNQIRKLSSGEDIAIISSGITTEEAMKAVKVLNDFGIKITSLHVSTLKPFNKKQLLEELKNIRSGIITVENHTIIGGLGSIVSEIIAEENINLPLIRLGLKDTFAHGASLKYLMNEYQINTMAIVKACEKLLDISTNIDNEDIDNVEINDMTVNSNPEDL
ncbi:MAG: transketolase [Spirochaetes bacterium]|nr:transketolase [Spirochaetota bacterium]